MADREKTTAEMVLALKRGGDPEENFQLLFERYYELLYRFFRRKGMLPEDCRDLTQETFLSVYKGLGELRDETRFEPWLYRIAMNVYRNEIERQQAKKRLARVVPWEEERHGSEDVHGEVAPTADSRTNPMAAVLDKEKKEKLLAALQAMPPQMRRCVQLRVLNESSTREIASLMGLSVNTVKAHLHQARLALREKLRPYFGDVDL